MVAPVSSVGSDPGAPRETPGPGLCVSDRALLVLTELYGGAPRLALTAGRVSLVNTEIKYIITT